MDTTLQSPKPNAQPPRGPFQRALMFLFRIVLPMVLLAAAALIVWRWMTDVPKAGRHNAERVARLVEVIPVQSGTHAVLIDAMGVVKPAQVVNLRPQVSGRLEWVDPSLTPGASFKAGQPLMRIEKRDYEIALARQRAAVKEAENAVLTAKSDLTLARSELQMEMGSQSVALREFELLNKPISEQNRALILREPQLQSARAEVEAAEARVAAAESALASAKLAVEMAELDLQRTTIYAPFNVTVETKHVDQGDTVTTATELVELIGTDTYWVELSIPESDMKWIELPDGDRLGSEVAFYNEAAWGAERCRVGQVIRRLPSVSAGGRMARLLVEVKDPMADGDGQAPVLLVGGYVRAEIIGQSFDNVIALPRELLHSGNDVHVMLDDNTLDLRRVDVLHRGHDTVLIRNGLHPNERVVTTDMAAPVTGTLLRVEATQATAPTGIEATTKTVSAQQVEVNRP